MAVSVENIREWLEEGMKSNATHMIVVCDTFDWEDYPVYVYKDENVREEYFKHNGVDMQKVMEVYSFNHDIEKQIAEFRAFHFD